MSKKGDEAPLDWVALVPLLVHETKIEILEAMLWIDEPLSAVDVLHMYEKKPKHRHVSTISYHLKSLDTDLSILRLYDEVQIRGAKKKNYYFRNRTPASRRRKRKA